MNHTEAAQYIKATLTAFGPGEAISMTKETWAKIHEAMQALAQPEQSQVEETLRYEIDALEAKLAECRAQQPEPVIDKSAAVRIATALGWTPQRKPLTDEDIEDLYFDKFSMGELNAFARAIEAAHGIWPENSDCHGPDWTDRDGEYLK